MTFATLDALETHARGAQCLHDARALKSVVADAIEEGTHAARRAAKSVERGMEQLEDLRDETIHRVKRQPLIAVGASFGTGLLVGVATAWIAGRWRTACEDEEH